MKEQHRAIRALLTTMSPRRAMEYVKAFELPEDEETALIECDVRGKSCIQTAETLHMSVDGLWKIRRRAYQKIADETGE